MSKSGKVLIIASVLSLPFWWGVNIFQQNLENFMTAEITEPLQNIIFIEIPQEPKKPEIKLQTISAESFRIGANGREKVLLQDNIDAPLPIASLTKLMAALITFENPQDYDFKKIITISSEAVSQENVPSYGNLKTGEKISIENLLNLMLFYSSNDAAFALSEVVGTENFVEKMNEKAKEIGLQNTNFTNPTGLDPQNENLRYDLENSIFFNYSTARDLVKLSQYILKEYPSIFDISIKEGPYPFKNGVSGLIIPENKKVVGAKTGYTDEAGGCMIVILSDQNNAYFINVILGAVSSEERIKEMQKLIDWIEL